MLLNSSRLLFAAIFLAACTWTAGSTLREKISVDVAKRNVIFRNPDDSDNSKQDDEEFTTSASFAEGYYDWNWNWLNKLLQNVQINIPDQTLTSLGETIDLTSMMCDKFSIGTINITNLPNHVLFVDVEGVKATCSGHFHTKPIVAKGDFKGAVSQSTFKGGIQLVYNNENIPVSATLASCDVSVKISLSFSGSLTAWLLNLLSGAISSFLESELKAQACALISPLVQTNMTLALHTLDDLLQPLLITATPSPTPSLPANTLNWTEFPPALALHDLLTSVPIKNLNGFINMLTHGLGTLMIPVTSETIVPTFLANFTFDLNAIGLSKVDTLTSLDLLDPIGGPVFNNYVGFDQLGVVLYTWIVLESKVSPGQYIANNISFAWMVDDPLFTVADAVAIRGDYPDVLGKVLVDQLFNVNCSIVPLVYTANFTHLNMSFAGDLYMQILGYDPDFDDVMTQLFAVIYSFFDESAPVMISNGLDTIVRDLVNSASTKFFETATCPAIPPPTSQYVDMREMNPIKVLNKVIDQDFTKRLNLNSIIRLLTNNTGGWKHEADVISMTLINDTAGTLHLALWDIELLNLDSWTNLTFLTPRVEDPYILDTNISFAGPGPEKGLAIKFSLSLKYTTRSTGEVTESAYAITVTLHDIQFTSTIKLYLNSTVYYNLAFEDIFDIAIIQALVCELDLESLDLKGNYTLDAQSTTHPTVQAAMAQVPMLSLLDTLQSTTQMTEIHYHESPVPVRLQPETLPAPFVVAYSLFNMLVTTMYGPFPSPVITPLTPSPTPEPTTTPSTTREPTTEIQAISPSSPSVSQVLIPVAASLGGVLAIAAAIALVRRPRRKQHKRKVVQVAMEANVASSLISGK